MSGIFPVGKTRQGQRRIIGCRTVSTIIERPEDIGRLVRAYRIQQALTQEDLAGLSGVGPRFVVELENGKPTVRLDKTLRILAMLGIKLVSPEPDNGAS